MIRLQFVMGSGLSSALITWFSAGAFSHVDCVLPSGDLLGARSDQIGNVAPGVQIRPPNYETWKRRVVMKLTVEPAKERKFLDFLHNQIGKPYDKTAILGFVAGRDWRAADSWFCSELQAAALEVATVSPLLYSPTNKITPAALALVMSARDACVESFAP